jgi:immunity protein 21 of polymorphic toxin system
MREAGVDWVESNGGPLLLLPEALLSDWCGSDDPPLWRQVQSRFRFNPEGVATDYDRACDVSGFVGALEVGEGFGLVLGDEPLPTVWIPAPFGGYLARRYVGEDSAVSLALSLLNRIESWQVEVIFKIVGEPLILFDAAEPGTDITGDRLIIPVETGDYRLDTALIGPKEMPLLRVHRLSRTRVVT